MEGTILVVDDDALIRTLHRKILANQYDVVTASSGKEAIEFFDTFHPDLVLMDAEMPDIDGYEACKSIREISKVPIIFVTANTSLDEHLHAYESGGTDLIVKPVNADLLLKKVGVTIKRYHLAKQSRIQSAEMEKMALNFLSTAGKTGVLLGFMRSSLSASSYEKVAANLLEATTALNLNCIVSIEHRGEKTVLAYHGTPTPLELAILDHAAGMGRIFQFKKRLVVNHDRVTIVVANVDSDINSPEAGIARDNIAILAEAAQVLAENIDIKQTAARQAEQMQLALSNAELALTQLSQNQSLAQADTRILLQELIANVEKSYDILDTTQAQEEFISKQMNRSVSRVLERLGSQTNFEQPLGEVITALRQGYENADGLEMF